MYYGGVEQIGTKESFGVYQYVTFREPSTGMLMVGKPHSFWWCKHDREYQVEMQPFAYVPLARRADVGEEQMIELDLQTATVEMPVAVLEKRIRTNVVYVPPSVPEKEIATFVRNAPTEYSDEALGVCCDDDPEEEEDEEEEEEETGVHWFWYKYRRTGEGRRKKRVLAMPPKFVDGWMSFCSQWSEFNNQTSPYWEHEFAEFVLEQYLNTPLTNLAPNQDPSQTFWSIETALYELTPTPTTTIDGGSTRKVRGAKVKWFPKSPTTTLDAEQLATLESVKDFLDAMKTSAAAEDAYDEVFRRCVVMCR